MKTIGAKIFYNQTEFGAMFGITRQTVFKKVRQGIIPTESVFGVKMIPGDYVEQAKQEFQFVEESKKVRK